MSQDAILGYFYLRMHYSRFGAGQPRTMSWVTLSRPYGTARWFQPTQDSRPGLFSAVPTGLNLERQPDGHCRDPLLLLWRLLLRRLLLLPWILCCPRLLLRAHSLQLLE